MPLVKCPTCGTKFDTEQSRVMPFCSPRCKQIDLGRWLKEGYSMPVIHDDEEEADQPSVDQEDLEENED